MKTINLLRHAKSSWDNPDLADFDRPLNTRGLQDAPFMGSIIYENNFVPDLIVSSPAKRAKQTAILIKETVEINTPITYIDQIYEASPTTLLKVASEFSDTNTSVLLIGHNPGIEGFIRILTGEIHQIPTATFTKINLSIEKWSDITVNCGSVEVIIRPKDMIQRVEL